ncbi:unnamed protein product [Cladocopium goreaui]|uniref:WWE domain-containing protein n=1 Tax=Cladocopium goreaui TaxID=2562237 RepID=A0A9P1FER8_9DINO|nr:unnamed protein product [Cladocopium goreaui]
MRSSYLGNRDEAGCEDSASTGRWEYEARGAFKAFEDDCQGEVERLFQEYHSGGQQRVTVKTGKIEISLDFKLMTSRVGVIL